MKYTVFSLDSCPFLWKERPSNQELTCDPRGSYIRMKCSILSAESASLAWFMTKNVANAGFDGFDLGKGDKFNIVPTTTEENVTFSSLVFVAEEETFGYYWCEVLFPSMNKATSPVVAVISNSSLPLCSDIARPYDPPSNRNMDCAVEEFSVSGIASSLTPTTLYSTSSIKYSISPSSRVSEVQYLYHIRVVLNLINLIR